ncbi:MAG: hypothetical protein EOS34_17185 [Mesorhizobium sp.]|nr:MAG: hypothetical protein EOS34_17185 [Mesorhizobium sp.]
MIASRPLQALTFDDAEIARGVTMANVFGALLFAAGLLAAMNAFVVTAAAENIMQQVYGGVAGMTAAVLIVGGSILMTIGSNGIVLGKFRKEMLAAAKSLETLNATLAKTSAATQAAGKECGKCGHNNPPGTTVCRCGNRVGYPFGEN